jgi:hypothetical protein
VKGLHAVHGALHPGGACRGRDCGHGTKPVKRSLGEEEQVGDEEEQVVDTVAIDDMPWSHCPRLIKVDVEGMEDEVLRGAAGLLRRCMQQRTPPVLYVESNDDNHTIEHRCKVTAQEIAPFNHHSSCRRTTSILIAPYSSHHTHRTILITPYSSHHTHHTIRITPYASGLWLRESVPAFIWGPLAGLTGPGYGQSQQCEWCNQCEWCVNQQCEWCVASPSPSCYLAIVASTGVMLIPPVTSS